MDPTPTIAQFMTPRPYSVDAELTLADAAERMRVNEIRHLVVLRRHRLAGVVSRRDLDFEAALRGRDASRVRIDVAMRPAFVCLPDTPLWKVAERMEAEHLDAAIIVDDDDDFVLGIFTLTDALHALRELIATGQGTRLAPASQPPRAALGAMATPHWIQMRRGARSLPELGR